MPEGTAPRTMFDQACASEDVQLDIVLQASAPDAVADLAKRGLGVAILTESMAVHHTARLRALRIDDIPTPVGLALVWTTAQCPRSRVPPGHPRDLHRADIPPGHPNWRPRGPVEDTRRPSPAQYPSIPIPDTYRGRAASADLAQVVDRGPTGPVDLVVLGGEISRTLASHECGGTGGRVGEVLRTEWTCRDVHDVPQPF